MSGPDPLFVIKTEYYIGSFRRCVKEAQKLQVGDQALALESDIFMYRAYIGEGKYGLVIDECGSRKGAEFRALTLIAKLLQNPAANRDSIMSEVGNVLNEGAVSLSPDLVALLCANIYLLDGDFESTLRVTNSTSSLDCMAVSVQTLLQMNRVDMAKKEVKKMQDIDEDATVSQLALAALNVALGQEKIQEAFYIYQELAEKFCPTPILLNGQATCLILQDKWEMAEDVLQKSLDKDNSHPETLANLYVVSQNLGAVESSKRYFAQLKDAHCRHSFVTNLKDQEEKLDQSTAALLANR